MKFSKSFKIACSVFMSIMLTNLPASAVANQGMISTSSVVEQLSREQTEKEVLYNLSRDEIKQTLIDNGISPQEVSSRLASLSDTELRQLSGQLSEARAGGDILVVIVLVLLIIFLAKRI